MRVILGILIVSRTYLRLLAAMGVWVELWSFCFLGLRVSAPGSMSRDSSEDAHIPEAEMTERISVFGYGRLLL